LNKDSILHHGSPHLPIRKGDSKAKCHHFLNRLAAPSTRLFEFESPRNSAEESGTRKSTSRVDDRGGGVFTYIDSFAQKVGTPRLDECMDATKEL
jgi:hypothetical protein